MLGLANQLRNDGLDARLDQYEPNPPEGWPRWTQRQLEDCDFVLLVCTDTYRRRFEGDLDGLKGRGVAWEGMVTASILYGDGARNYKMVAVLFEDGAEADIPRAMRSFSYYRLPKGYEDLYRYLTDQPRHPPPPHR